MKIHQPPMSTAALKVSAVVHELGLPVTFVDVDFRNRQHKSPEFLAMNPNGKVPTLEDDGFYLWESNAILCYLAAQKPQSGLLPSEPRAMAHVQQWLQWQASTFSPSTTEVMMETVYATYMNRTPDPEKLAVGLEHVRRDLGVLETVLEGKEYLCGRLTLADFSICSSLMMRGPMGVDLGAYPNVKAWVARMEARESVRKAMPPL